MLFPFDKEILVSEALFLIRNKIVNEYVYRMIQEALYYDPYSVEILGMHIQYAEHFKNKNEAKKSFKLLKQISPNSKITNELSKRF